MKKLIGYLSSELGIKDQILLEKDIILHKLLCMISDNGYLRENLVFKGGTCLIKCYLGYFRFSEDLDFTWIKQEEFKKKSQKEIRRLLSKKIIKIALILEGIAKGLNLDFKPVKSNKRYIELGGSNKFSTFKLWYKSETLNTEQFIKIQINFLELFLHSFKTCRAVSIVEGVKIKEFNFLFPEHSVLITKPSMECYDLKEILTEKFRAILTRRGIKTRDFIDLFLITKKKRIAITRFRGEILDKTKFMLRYDKYVQNLKGFNLGKFVLEEEKLMLIPLEDGFEKFLEEAHKLINSIAEELL
ncbi:MAG: nucleotidyl transferase AbiEii/AbiGii toxin family protein [Candidatus Woesearchaeota archaeon]